MTEAAHEHLFKKQITAAPKFKRDKSTKEVLVIIGMTGTSFDLLEL